MLKSELITCFLKERMASAVDFPSCFRVLSVNTVQCHGTGRRPQPPACVGLSAPDAFVLRVLAQAVYPQASSSSSLKLSPVTSYVSLHPDLLQFSLDVMWNRLGLVLELFVKYD